MKNEQEITFDSNSNEINAFAILKQLLKWKRLFNQSNRSYWLMTLQIWVFIMMMGALIGLVGMKWGTFVHERRDEECERE